MAAKTKVAKRGVKSAGQTVRDNEYLQRLMEDAELRENLRAAYESARKAYGRIANGRGPTKALLEDKKTHRELQNAASSLRDAAEGLRGKRRRKRGRGGKLLLLVVAGGVAALFASEDLRKKALDLVFGAEEEFEYSSTTTPQTAAPPPPPQP
jgi:hypothetical protein